jgi:hypothetical protein
MVKWWWGPVSVLGNSGEDSSSEEEGDEVLFMASEVVEVTRGEKAEKGFCQFIFKIFFTVQ